MNLIQAVFVCDTNGSRQSLMNKMNKYAGQEGISDDPVSVPLNGTKYGAGPAMLLMAWFGDNRAVADEAWLDLKSLGEGWIIPTSHAIQTADDVVIHHEVWWPDGKHVFVPAA